MYLHITERNKNAMCPLRFAPASLAFHHLGGFVMCPTISLFAMTIAATFALALPASAQELKALGSVTYEPEPVDVQIGTFAIRPEDRRIRSLRIKIEEGAASVRSLKITYADGDEERVRVRQDLTEGQRSNLLKLEEPKPIKTIEVFYVPKGAVELVLLAETRRQPPPPPPAEWVELGCKKVGFIADQDIFPVNSPDRYAAIRLRSVGFEIEVLEMGVRYGNGARDIYRIGAVIPPGGRTGPIELRGDARRIRDIGFVYRTGTISTSRTRLCVDGLKFVERLEDEEDE
jgi:hypothetical protein